MIHLDYRDPRPVYAQIVDSVIRQIQAGVMIPGEKLPSVRELAGQLAINPNTIQRAYRELESQGWVTAQQGKGLFVTGLSLREDPLLQEFDRLVAKLERQGITRQQLMERLEKGGNENAEDV